VSRFNGHGPVVGIDIDGTLGDYHAHFIRFAEGYTGRDLPSPADINPAMPFRQFLGIGKQTYRDCKLAYRQGGMKRSMPVYPHARDLTVNLRKAGVEVIICTSRPFNQLGNVDGDTRHWLKRNGIQFDGLMWGENKYRDLRRRFGIRIVTVLEDLPSMVDQAFESRLGPIIRDQPYNRHKHEGPKGEMLQRALNLEQAQRYILSDLENWKEAGF
jgi:hypothetical protein